MSAPLPSTRVRHLLKVSLAECRLRNATQWRMPGRRTEPHERPPRGCSQNVKRRIGELRLEAAEQAKASLQVLLLLLRSVPALLWRPDA